jgi:hypothetical protein
MPYPNGASNVTVQHGNYLGAAYAKIKGNHGWCYSIHVQVVYSDGNGQLQNALWEAGRPPDAGVWYQSTQHYANIVGSNYYVCPWYGVCYFYQFSAI